MIDPDDLSRKLAVLEGRLTPAAAAVWDPSAHYGDGLGVGGGRKAEPSFRWRWLRCGGGCAGCPHGPYLYARLRVEGKRVDVCLGRRPTRAVFFRKLSAYVDGAVLRRLVREVDLVGPVVSVSDEGG